MLPNELKADASAASSTIGEIFGIAKIPMVAESNTVDCTPAHEQDEGDKRDRITYNQKEIRIFSTKPVDISFPVGLHSYVIDR